MSKPSQPNYLVIFLIILLIAMHAYYNNKILKAHNVINQQGAAINSQQKLIDLYKIYYLTPQNSPIHNDLKDPIIKQPI